MNAPTPFSPPLNAVSSAAPVELEGLLASFWDRSTLGLMLVDARGTIVAVNAAFCETVGLRESDLVGSSMTRLLAPEVAARGSAAHAAFISGDGRTAMELTYLHKSGRALFAHATDTRVEAADGRVFRLTSLMDLSRHVQSLKPSLQHQRTESFTLLAADISNDFNNLLSIILGYSAFIQDGALDAMRVNTAVKGIDHAVRRAANLIRQTLHLSRREELAFQRVFLSDFVREFHRMTGDTAMAGLRVEFDLQEGLPAVSLDPQHLHHALANICQKGRELTGMGGRLVFTSRHLDGPKVRAKFNDARESAYVVLTLRVEPTARVLTRLDPPDRWESAVLFAERRRDLTVLVAHSIMGNHRGYLELDPWSGPALAFHLYLPAVTSAVVEPPALPVATRPSTGRTVLVVDDEETLLHALCFVLERSGFEVIKARDGVDAVERYIEHAPRIALVLMDLGLPRMSGWEAFVKIKEHTPSINVLIMSGHLEANLQTEILKAGARGFLQKPFAMAEAISEVKRFFVPAGN
jgi:two-component system, cell cycle sensor histidine kinase and response regulator CckA